MKPPRETWNPTPTERAEHEARHAQALADHAQRMYTNWLLANPQPLPTDEELLS